MSATAKDNQKQGPMTEIPFGSTEEEQIVVVVNQATEVMEDAPVATTTEVVTTKEPCNGGGKCVLHCHLWNVVTAIIVLMVVAGAVFGAKK